MFSSGNVLPVKIQPPLLRPLAYRVLSKKYGLNIKSDGLAILADFVGKTFGTDWKKNNITVQFLEKFAIVWKQQERGVFVDGQGVKDVISEMKEREKATSATNVGILPTARSLLAENKERGAVEDGLGKQKQGTLDKLLVNNDTQEETIETDAELEIPASPILESQKLESPIPVSPEPINQRTEQNENGGDTTAEEEKEQLDWKNYFKIVNATEQPKYSYDPRKLQFVFGPAALQDSSQELKGFDLPNIKSKVELFSTRFYLVRDRVLRNENFQKTDTFNPLSSIIALQNDLSGTDSLPGMLASMSITQIKNLVGRDGQSFLLLGLLAKNPKGIWCLEDPSGTVEIDLSQAVPTPGLYYVPGCFVLAEGIYYTVGNRFHVSSLTHPPGERREITLDAIGNLDLLGIHSSSNSKFVPRLDTELKVRLHLLEKELVDHRFVILGGDIFLDESSTFDALRKIFKSLEDDPPIVIIFHGSFSAVPVHASMSSRNVSSTTQYRTNFNRLADLLSEFDNITKVSRLVFVPGVNDPWGSMVSLSAAHVWPIQPIPSTFTSKLKKVCKNVILASNPTRIAYLSQEILITRDDMTSRFKRHNISFPIIEQAEQEARAENEIQEKVLAENKINIDQLVKGRDKLPAKIKESRKLVKTLLDQGQISPFTSAIRPLVWNLDQALSMYPIPSTLIVCDTSAPQFDLTYNGCKSINPGKFIVGKKARYIEYRPSLKRVSQEELAF